MSEKHAATLHGDRVVCTCGDFNCASLDRPTPTRGHLAGTNQPEETDRG